GRRCVQYSKNLTKSQKNSWRVENFIYFRSVFFYNGRHGKQKHDALRRQRRALRSAAQGGERLRLFGVGVRDARALDPPLGRARAHLADERDARERTHAERGLSLCCVRPLRRRLYRGDRLLPSRLQGEAACPRLPPAQGAVLAGGRAA